MGKYDHINMKPSQSTASAAKRGLELRRKQPKSGKAGLSAKQAKAQGIGSGVQRASNMANRKTLSSETWKRVKAYHDRHAKNRKLDPGKKPHEDKGYVASLLWGGDAGYSQAKKIVRQMEAADKKSKGGRRKMLRSVVKSKR